MTDFFGAMGTALYSKLSTNSTLTTALGGSAIYDMQAPEGAALPYVIFSHQGGGPENITAGGLRNNVWQVRAFSTSLAQANLIDGYCQTALGGSVTVSGFNNFWLAREEDIQLVENPPDNVRIYSAGGLYRIRLT